MSLVQAYLYHDFVLVGADTRGLFLDETYVDGVHLVHKVGPDVIIGMVGDLEANYQLFSNYINPDCTLKVFDTPPSFKDVCSDVIQKLNDDFDYYRRHGINSVVCGYDGSAITGIRLFAFEGAPDITPITDLTPENDHQIMPISCGHQLHFNYMTNRLNEGLKDATIRSFKNLFLDALEAGHKIDMSINNQAEFAKIRLADFHADEASHSE